MVLKPFFADSSTASVWEWCKNVWYSNLWHFDCTRKAFENDVKMYGTQTIKVKDSINLEFENDVKMYGTQTIEQAMSVCLGLRMM